MKRFRAILMLLCLCLSICPAALAGDPYGSVILNGKDGTVTIYAKASKSAATVGTFYNGTMLSFDTRVDSLEDSWIKVDLYDSLAPVKGYVRGGDVVSGEVEIAPFTYGINKSVPKAYPCAVTDADAALYDGTGKKNAVISKFGAGVSVSILGEKNDYYYICVTGMQTHGYMRKDSLSPTGERGTDEAELPQIGKATVYASKEPDQNAVPVYASCLKTDMLRQYADRSAVAVHWRLGDWALVSLLNISGRTMNSGFIESRFLDENADHSLPLMYVRTDETTDRLMMRYQNDKDAAYYAKFFPGVRVTLLSGAEKWSNSDYSFVRVGDVTGYFKNEFLLSSAVNPPRYAVVSQSADEYMPNYYEYEKRNVRFEKGDQVTLLGSRDAGIYVQTADGRYAYAPIECLMPDGDAYVFTAKVNASSLKMRAAADEDGDVLRSLSKNTSVKVLIHGDVWSKIEYKNEIGYVMTRHLKY